jgi:RNA polymerase sigma-70 factor (ECF subfamily)
MRMRKLQMKNDHDLVMDYIHGNQASFDELLSRHRSKVFSYIMLMVKDQDVAEDIFQDTFIKVIKTLKTGKYTEEGKFLSWVMRIAHNLVIDHFRRAKRMPSVEKGAGEDYDVFSFIKIPDSSPEEKLMKQQTYDRLQKLIEKLPKEQKEVLYMRHYADMSFQEIADQTQVSINTALGRMRYAIINLRKLMHEHQMHLMD